MANDNRGNSRGGGGRGGGGGGGRGGGSANEAWVFVIYAYGRSPVFTTPFFVNQSVGIFTAKIVQIWKKFFIPLFIFLDIVLVGTLIFSIFKAWPTRPHLTLFHKSKPRKSKSSGKKMMRQWGEIDGMLAKGEPQGWRIAVIEGDSLVDKFLMYSGYKGDHLADRLAKIIPGELESLEDVWTAHRLRNNIVSAPGIAITQKEAQKAVDSYKAFLKELGAL
jgi:hypothetical protein